MIVVSNKWYMERKRAESDTSVADSPTKAKKFAQSFVDFVLPKFATYEAMEQQTISIAKARITTVLNFRTSMLPAANPPLGLYDGFKGQKSLALDIAIGMWQLLLSEKQSPLVDH
ncbi:hypothetical protein REPUB_Repub09cG0033500 [Reevesia pubescens]